MPLVTRPEYELKITPKSIFSGVDLFLATSELGFTCVGDM